jgi:hypothetical protein
MPTVSSPRVAPRPPDEPGPPDRPLPTARWRWLVLGAAIAWLGGTLVPARFVWFLCALPHEMGHATFGCLLGHPSAPAIGLTGDAWTGIADRRDWLVWAMALGAAAAAAITWRRGRRGFATSGGLLAVLVPALAFAPAADVVIAAGGHLGELLFAGYCFALAWTGGRTGTAQERTACAFAAALIQAQNAKLCFGLMTSPLARAEYATNGSLGLKNDYLVLAEDLLHCRLESVAFGLLGLCLLPLPLGLWLGARRAAADGDC